MKMSIHRALSELKLLDSKISKKINNDFIKVKKASASKIGGVKVEEVKENIESSFNSVKDLIERRADIKSKIIQSNAVTKVKLAGKEFTVAEAIDLKSSINYKRDFLETLDRQYRKCTNEVMKNDEIVAKNADDYINGLYSDKNSVDPNKIKNLRQDFIEENKLELVDPVGISDYIKELDDFIEEFETNVDFVLSESNATTFIDIE